MFILKGLLSKNWIHRRRPSCLKSHKEYFVTAEKISNKQVAFAIYTLYFPALDMEVSIDSKSIIEKNKICVQKINLLKEKQNPRINRHIQNINNLIIEVLENWTNDVNKNVDIYG